MSSQQGIVKRTVREDVNWIVFTDAICCSARILLLFWSLLQKTTFTSRKI